MLRRSQLFVPGNDEKKIRKSVSLGSDSVIFDLEDAVSVEEKSRARKLVSSLLRELDWRGKEICVRINPVQSPYFKDDLAEFATEGRISSFVIPKAEERLTALQEVKGKNLIPLIETARGLLRIEDIIRSEGVVAVSYGAADFANSMRGRVETYAGNVYVKTLIAVAAKAHGLDPIDNVFFDLTNIDGFRREAQQSRDLGYVGKQVVHPSQIDVANQVFSPTAEECERASRVVEAYERAISKGTGAVSLEGQLVDAVHYRQARQILEEKRLIDELTKSSSNQ